MEVNRKLTHSSKAYDQSESGDAGHVAITFDDESTEKLRYYKTRRIDGTNSSKRERVC
jgi:hypothetical protein